MGDHSEVHEKREPPPSNKTPGGASVEGPFAHEEAFVVCR